MTVSGDDSSGPPPSGGWAEAGRGRPHEAPPGLPGPGGYGYSERPPSPPGPWAGQYPQPPLARPTSGLAVAAFISALVWGCGVLSALGLVLGIVAMQETKTGVKGGHGLAVAAVIIGALGLVPAAFWLMGMLALGLSGSSG